MTELTGTIIGLIAGIIIGLIILAIVTLIFRWLWNSTLPDVFGLKSLSFWQAFKILLISSMLFGGGTKVIERGHEVVPDDAIEQTAG
jgi:hypothetical protein